MVLNLESFYLKPTVYILPALKANLTPDSRTNTNNLFKLSLIPFGNGNNLSQ